MIPYDHWVLDDFFPVDVARRLANEFPDYNESNWHWYNNPLENKKAKNSWYEFPQLTYQIFSHLNSAEFMETISGITGIKTLKNLNHQNHIQHQQPQSHHLYHYYSFLM